MLDAINFLAERSQGLRPEEFLANEVLKRAFVRSLEVIGEAVKKLPAEFRQKYSHIDWRAIAGTRDKLIHDYFGVDYEIVWDIVISEVPQLKEQVENILQEESK